MRGLAPALLAPVLLAATLALGGCGGTTVAGRALAVDGPPVRRVLVMNNMGLAF